MKNLNIIEQNPFTPTSYGVSVQVDSKTLGGTGTSTGSICIGKYGLSNPYIVYPDGRIAFDLHLSEKRYLRSCKAIKLINKRRLS
jgi:hypothetical protein